MNAYLKLWLAFVVDKYKYYFRIKSLSFFAFVSLRKIFRIKEPILKFAYGVHQSHDHFHLQTDEVLCYKQTITDSQGKDHWRREQ